MSYRKNMNLNFNAKQEKKEKYLVKFSIEKQKRHLGFL
jgi:hypothetical protein